MLALAGRRHGAPALERWHHHPVIQSLLHPGKRGIAQMNSLQRHAVGGSTLVEIAVLQESLDCIVQLSIEVTFHHLPLCAARLRAALAFNRWQTRQSRFCSICRTWHKNQYFPSSTTTAGIPDVERRRQSDGLRLALGGLDASK